MGDNKENPIKVVGVAELRCKRESKEKANEVMLKADSAIRNSLEQSYKFMFVKGYEERQKEVSNIISTLKANIDNDKLSSEEFKSLVESICDQIL
jgi:hypothetical protein